MAELANCTACGKVFVKMTTSLCPDCRKKAEDEFRKVYEFIRDQKNREATVFDVHQATAVEEEVIYEWIKTGKLRTAAFKNLAYPCEHCGTMIQEGLMCKSCLTKIEKDLSESVALEIRKNQLRKENGPTYYTK